MTSPQDKAFALVGRYARLQVRSHQCKLLTSSLLGRCEDLRHSGDGEGDGWSACMEAYRQWKSEAKKGHEKRPNSPQGWDALLEQDLEFCRACRLAMRVWSHRKTIHRRRASVLGAMRRLGLKGGAA